MKIRNRTSILLAAALAGLLPAVSQAATTSANPNDLLLGFRVSGGTGQTTALLVNLGQVSVFASATAGSTFTLNIGNLAADLNAFYGSDWANRSDLFWGVVGTNESASPRLYATRDSSQPGWGSLPLDELNATSGAITSVIYGTNGYHNKNSTTNSNVAVAQTGAGGAQSWIQQVAGNPLDFGAWSSIETSVGGDGTLSLYRVTETSSTFLGTFALANSGALTFTAVPEPSAALLGLAGTSLLALRRRRVSAR